MRMGSVPFPFPLRSAFACRLWRALGLFHRHSRGASVERMGGEPSRRGRGREARDSLFMPFCLREGFLRCEDNWALHPPFKSETKKVRLLFNCLTAAEQVNAP